MNIKIPVDLVKSNLSSNAKAIYMYILANGGEKTMSLEEIGKVISVIDRRYIKKYVTELIEEKWLSVTTVKQPVGRPLTKYIAEVK